MYVWLGFPPLNLVTKEIMYRSKRRTEIGVEGEGSVMGESYLLEAVLKMSRQILSCSVIM